MSSEDSLRRAMPLIPHELDPSDPANQEHRTMLEFMRSLSIGRLIAVVGSGTTTIYGYETWDQFIANLCHELIEMAKDEKMGVSNKKLMNQSGIDLCLNILAPGTSEGLKYGALDRDEKLAICGAVIDCLDQEGKKKYNETMKEWFGPRTVYKWSDFETNSEVQELLKEIKENLPASAIAGDFNENIFLPPDLSRLLQILPIKHSVFRHLTEDERKKGYYPHAPEDKISAYRNVCDPLAKLRSALNIHRYATFNYDLQIESLLEDLDYPFNSLTDTIAERADSISESRIGGIARSISLSAANSAELIALAAIPSSANDMIVHMHGSVAHPVDMIITQSNYNNLYVEKHSNRHAFEDARNLIFGGNAVIHIGFGLTEDDLMRPLRNLSANRRSRPLFALMPLLESEAKSNAFAHMIKLKYGVNVVTYGLSRKNIHKIQYVKGEIKHPLESISENFISLGEELQNISSLLDPTIGVKLPDKHSTPRLYYSKIAITAINYINKLETSKIDAREEELKFFIGFLKSIAISTALNNSLEYFQASVVRWQKGFNIGPERTQDFISNDYGCVARSDSNYKKPTASRTRRSVTSNEAEALFKEDSRSVKKIFDSLTKSNLRFVCYQFVSGQGKGTFVSHLRDIAKEHYGIKSNKDKAARFIALDYTMRAKSVMTDIIDNIQETSFLCLNNADQLLDKKFIAPRNVFILDFLRFLRSSSNKKIHIVAVVRKESSKIFYENFFNAKKNRVSYGSNPRKLFSSKLQTIVMAHKIGEENKSQDEEVSNILDMVLKSNRWANILLSQLSSQLKEWGVCTEQEFLEECKKTLANKSFGINAKFHSSLLCGIALEQRQRFTQNSVHSNGRKFIVIENIILKWMFSIFIAIDRRTILKIPEIARLLSNKEASLKYEITKETVHSAIDSLLSNGLIYRLDLQKDKEHRYVLHGAVRQYLAHKRGLSFDELSSGDAQSITLTPALTDRGPTLNAEDYRSTCELVDCFLLGETPQQSDNNEIPAIRGKYKYYKDEDRIVLRSAYAVLKDVLNVQNSMRAGLAYPSENTHSSLLSMHLGRLARLRSAALAERQDYKKAKDISSPVIYWHDRVWLLNELAVVRYLQGNFHDSILIFRQALQSVESEQSLDPLLRARLLINLSLCLIERARFIDAITSIEDAIRDLQRISELDDKDDQSDSQAKQETKSSSIIRENPEYKLLYAIALGCKAQVQLLSAELVLARESIKAALNSLSGLDVMGARGWLHHIRSSIALASGEFDTSKRHNVLALAAARGSQRPDLILSFEIAEIEFELRNAGFSRDSVLTALARLEELEITVRILGSYKLQVGILLLRARALLTMEQSESARAAVLEAISLAQLNGMRLRRISGLVLLVALMAMRGEQDAAKKLLKSVKLAATRSRYIRAVVEIEGLEQSIEVDGSIPSWAGYVSEFSRSSQSHLPRKL